MTKMVASEVPIATCVDISGAIPWNSNARIRIGTITTPPPRPKRPLISPATAPKAR